MRSTKSKNQNEQIPSEQGRAAESGKLSPIQLNQYGTDNPELFEVKLALIDLFGYQSLEGFEVNLVDNLKADIGHDIGCGQRLPIDITYQLGSINTVVAFLYNFPIILSDINLNTHPELQELQEVLGRIDYKEVYKLLFSGFQNWIYQDDSYETASIDYIVRTSAVYKDVIDALRMCHEVHLALNSQKGGASC